MHAPFLEARFEPLASQQRQDQLILTIDRCRPADQEASLVEASKSIAPVLRALRGGDSGPVRVILADPRRPAGDGAIYVRGSAKGFTLVQLGLDALEAIEWDVAQVEAALAGAFEGDAGIEMPSGRSRQAELAADVPDSVRRDLVARVGTGAGGPVALDGSALGARELIAYTFRLVSTQQRRILPTVLDTIDFADSVWRQACHQHNIRLAPAASTRRLPAGWSRVSWSRMPSAPPAQGASRTTLALAAALCGAIGFGAAAVASIASQPEPPIESKGLGNSGQKTEMGGGGSALEPTICEGSDYVSRLELESCETESRKRADDIRKEASKAISNAGAELAREREALAVARTTIAELRRATNPGSGSDTAESADGAEAIGLSAIDQVQCPDLPPSEETDAVHNETLSDLRAQALDECRADAHRRAQGPSMSELGNCHVEAEAVAAELESKGVAAVGREKLTDWARRCQPAFLPLFADPGAGSFEPVSKAGAWGQLRGASYSYVRSDAIDRLKADAEMLAYAYQSRLPKPVKKSAVAD